MVENFFGLRDEPFSIAPDPRFLYLSAKHQEALLHLTLSITRGASFVLLTGEIGAGKTTVWRRFLENLPANVDVATVVNPRLDVRSLLARVVEDLSVELPAGPQTPDLIDALHGHILLTGAQGRRTLIAIDEAQALSLDVMEQLRLLTNLDATGKKLTVLLIAQPEMRQMLERPELEPLNQRIVARYHLRALSEAECTAYVTHRLSVAGLDGPLPFDEEALAAIHLTCGGVPRRINVLCDRALAIAALAQRRRIGPDLIAKARLQAFGEPLAPPLPPPPPRATAPAGEPVPAPAPPPALPKSQREPRAPVFIAVAVAAVIVGATLSRHFGNPAAPAVAAPVAAVAPAPSPTVPRPAGPSPVVRPVTDTAALPASGPVTLVSPVTEPAVALAPPRGAATAAPETTVASAAEGTLEATFTPVAADEGFGLRSLALRWGVDLAGGEPCAAAAQRQLGCYRARGGLVALRQLDRPALLRLADASGRVAHAQLVAFQGDAAVLSVAGTLRKVAPAELARWWRGDYVTFWRLPPGYREGESGPTAAWLGQQLSHAETSGPPLGPDAPAGLRERLIAFQVLHGLTPDGVAGPLTVMQLNHASGIDEPRLTAATSGSRPS